MRRLILNSTTLAGLIALSLPYASTAETLISADEAMAQAIARAADLPAASAQLAAEIAGGLTPDGLLCESGAERPCPDADRLLTPGGLTVLLSEDGQMVPAPADAQVNPQMLAQDSRPATEPTAPDATIAASGDITPEAAPETVGAETVEDASAQPADETPDQPAIAEPDAVAQGADPATTEALGATLSVEKPPATPADTSEQATASAAASQGTAVAEAPEDALTAALRAAAQAAEQDIAKAEPVLPQDNAPLSLAQGSIANSRAAEMQALAEILRAEVAAGLKADQLRCETGEAPPCGDGIAMLTPQGVLVEGNGQPGEIRLAAAARQLFRVDDQGKLVARAAEEGTGPTETAREAAQQQAAPRAAALDDSATASAPALETTVTAADTRSSAEDFETRLTDALAQQAKLGQQADQTASAASKDNNLARALITGIGAIAVGQMLEGNRQVALAAPDRLVLQRADGSQEIVKDDTALLRQAGSNVTTENFDDGSSRSIVTRPDGSKVVTIRDANLQVLRRTLVAPDGKTTQLIDDTADVQPVDIRKLPQAAPPTRKPGPLNESALRDALRQQTQSNRAFTLSQIRNIPEVRALVAPVDLDAITFDTGSAAISPNQARALSGLGRVIQDAIAKNPREIFMVEGHTDTVGAAAMNLALSDRRAESVALALTEYFAVPPENLVVQGYGEQYLKIRAQGDIRANRRASVRRITDLLRVADN